MSKLIRNCPVCDKIIIYKNKSYYNNANKYNRCCSRTCSSGLYTKNINNKICCMCKSEKSKNQFFKNQNTKDKFSPVCKLCQRESTFKYRANHLEKIKSTQSAYRKNNKEKEIKRHKEYRIKYPDRVKNSNIKYRNKAGILDKLHEYDAEYRKQNKDKIYKKQKEYCIANPDKIREKSRRRRAKKKQIIENYTTADEQFTYNLFNHKCFNCLSSENLTIDHHLPLSKGFALTINNAVILCKSCNSSKGDLNPQNFYSKSQLKILNNLLKIK